MGPIGERGGQLGQAVPLPPSVSESDKGRGGAPPFLLPLPLLPSPSLPLGGNLLGLGVLVGFPSWGRAIESWPASPFLLYIRGRGHPKDTTIDLFDLLAVCDAPSTIVH